MSSSGNGESIPPPALVSISSSTWASEEDQVLPDISPELFEGVFDKQHEVAQGVGGGGGGISISTTTSSSGGGTSTSTSNLEAMQQLDAITETDMDQDQGATTNISGASGFTGGSSISLIGGGISTRPAQNPHKRMSSDGGGGSSSSDGSGDGDGKKNRTSFGLIGGTGGGGITSGEFKFGGRDFLLDNEPFLKAVGSEEKDIRDKIYRMHDNLLCFIEPSYKRGDAVKKIQEIQKYLGNDPTPQEIENMIKLISSQENDVIRQEGWFRAFLETKGANLPIGYEAFLDRFRASRISLRQLRLYVMSMSNTISYINADVRYHIEDPSSVDLTPAVPVPAPVSKISVPGAPAPFVLPTHLTDNLLLRAHKAIDVFAMETGKKGRKDWEEKARAVRKLEEFLISERLAVDATQPFRFINANKTLSTYKIWWKKDGTADWEAMCWDKLLKTTDRYKSYLSVIFKERDNFRNFLCEIIDRGFYEG